MELPNLDPPLTLERVRAWIVGPDAQNDPYALYNPIMEAARADPANSLALAQCAVEACREIGEPDAVQFLLELVVRCSLPAKEFSVGIEALREMQIPEPGEYQEEVLVELAEDLMKSLGSDDFPKDLAPRILAAVIETYDYLKKPELKVEAYLEAAHHFSHYKATQAAYRALDDAEQAALQAKSLPLLARVYMAGVVLGFDETDFAWAVEAGKRAIAVHEEMKASPPPHFLMNWAMARQHTGDGAGAQEVLEAIAAATDDASRAISHHVHLNLSVVRRLNGDLEAAREALSIAKANFDPDFSSETIVEFELVTARQAEAVGDLATQLSCLQNAARAIDQQLSAVYRLHYRRGIRERVQNRIEGAIRRLPAVGLVDDVIEILCHIHSNMLTDWLGILDWIDEAQLFEGADAELKAALKRAAFLIKDEGAPFMMGLFEKYDDPFDPRPWDRPWDQFASIAEKFVILGMEPPTSKTTLANLVSLVRARLGEGYAIIVPSISDLGPNLWVLVGAEYQRVDFPREATSHFIERHKYSFAMSDRADFAAHLTELTTKIGGALAGAFDHIAASSCLGVFYLRDIMNVFPLTMLIASHPVLHARMEKGELEVCVVPAIYEKRETEPIIAPACAVLVDSGEDLLLAAHEGDVAARTMSATSVAHVNLNNEDEYPGELANADVILVSGHGIPLAGFTDPMFGSLRGQAGSGLSFGFMQHAFPDYACRLLMLNACHTGSGSFGNYSGTYRTHDVASYPAIALTNRKSVVGASAWQTSDTASFVHLQLVAEGIAEGLSAGMAISRATAKLKALKKSEVVELLRRLPDQRDAEKAVQRIERAPEDGMFSQPYIFGCFEAYSLM